MILGVDCGQTALKAVIFDDEGRELGTGRCRTNVSVPAPHAAERDMAELAHQLDGVIRQAVSAADVDAGRIRAVGLVAHGDGIYPVDAAGRPTRPAFLALDGRSGPILDRWDREGVLAQTLALTGQRPHAGSQAPLAAWWSAHEPATLAATAHLLYCKDWLRLGLTGELATDTVEAASCVGRMDGEGYEPRALAAYGLLDLRPKLPTALRPAAVAGVVTDDAAKRTGLAAGTPVVTGTHDVVASALGSGATVPGDYSVQAGTYSVNQLIDGRRVSDERWQSRPWVVPGQWVAMGASPSSASNLDWFVRELMDGVDDPISVANREAAAVADDETTPIFHPFLFGSPYGPHASASFLGLRHWHGRPHLLRAVFEGVVFNHRMHLDALAERAPRRRIHLSGGAARSDVWSQLFADVLNCEVAVTESTEHGALGAAMLAGVGTGMFGDVEEATRACVRADRVFSPAAGQRTRWEDRYARYLHTVEALSAIWAAPAGLPS
ncbi:FGGY-family carbohydrate kinase [Pseudonocardia nigra]|uniref:FGGY-family carbohydrate kinase n=1 Tax=Pseudonocardia nigra TaxID=1921578 RepID=UPI001C5FA41F|nr:FGGY-family carbohydrate kinase [Pseudonocardia nigra]